MTASSHPPRFETLKNLGSDGYVTLTLHPTPLFQPESGHPTRDMKPLNTKLGLSGRDKGCTGFWPQSHLPLMQKPNHMIVMQKIFRELFLEFLFQVCPEQQWDKSTRRVQTPVLAVADDSAETDRPMEWWSDKAGESAQPVWLGGGVGGMQNSSMNELMEREAYFKKTAVRW